MDVVCRRNDKRRTKMEPLICHNYTWVKALDLLSIFVAHSTGVVDLHWCLLRRFLVSSLVVHEK